ncbi:MULTISPECIES: helix-turn-helix transcriptional regulator [unclassified Microcystis]|jgi:DNA-binding transcriptional regulator YiaG|uniref:helix-turn-helix domain-containing protein n=1 Tax=unclassified Microcystis TaxID=2643300 RepID=UPI00257ECA95|nr:MULTISPECIES: helix-turn-helix transcriptional regulator [unclassified Microcystis]MCA2926986.1 helix-turn-helix transcriptional regulator [Microcystis sp. M020S1]MCA2935681.1 helix-turn-helix transcriptional regulator [Microcystis sp. M015S1]NCQ84578.1 helix-turn-helix transcriptional regulator [Microcystis aeruginosa W13-18]NCR37805.1 helix-turn-helix transcriptional regulator [Microcystis aeruginosa S11-05]NCR51306.1 helix-turn-helix transcriptional regulator [Microcystis aeruginosa S11-
MEPVAKVKLVEGENALKQIRQALGMSQRKFAEALGTYQKTVVRWENGETKAMLSLAQIKALQKAMRQIGLDIEDLPDDL